MPRVRSEPGALSTLEPSPAIIVAASPAVCGYRNRSRSRTTGPPALPGSRTRGWQARFRLQPRLPRRCRSPKSHLPSRRARGRIVVPMLLATRANAVRSVQQPHLHRDGTITGIAIIIGDEGGDIILAAQPFTAHLLPERLIDIVPRCDSRRLYQGADLAPAAPGVVAGAAQVVRIDVIECGHASRLPVRAWRSCPSARSCRAFAQTHVVLQQIGCAETAIDGDRLPGHKIGRARGQIDRRRADLLSFEDTRRGRHALDALCQRRAFERATPQLGPHDAGDDAVDLDVVLRPGGGQRA